MKLLFELRPVEHLEASVEYYRGLDLEPIAWPDDDSALLAPRRADQPTLVLVRDPAEAALGTGGVYDVGGVDDFYRAHPSLDWLIAPIDSALGRYAVFADRTGAPIRLLDPAPQLSSPAAAARPVIYAVAG